MKQVKILKDGEHNNFQYKKGEIYPLLKISKPHAYLDVDNNGDNVLVSIEHDNQYGLEAEIIEIPEHNLTLVL